MKNKELIELLQKYPEDAEIYVLGYEYQGCGERGTSYFKTIEVDFDKKYNELMLEGDDGG